MKENSAIRKILQTLVVLIIIALIGAPTYICISYKKEEQLRQLNINKQKLKTLALAVKYALSQKGKCDSIPTEYLPNKDGAYDIWGNPFLLEPDKTGKHLILSSLGSDGKSGGSGNAADWIVRINKKPPYKEEYIFP
jgi:hypothetical protein